jgi:hypothetical protein
MLKLSMISGLRRCAAAAILAMSVAACGTSDLDFNRIPYARVYVPFTTIGDWHNYGVSGALQSRRFIKTDTENQPSGYVYPVVAATGFGGILLVCDVSSNVVAMDLACPVELNRTVRVAVDSETNMAKCPKCGSTYDVFNLNGAGAGVPTSGPAINASGKKTYALTRYTVVYNVDNRYALITN